MFPGCGSAWYSPSRSTWSRNAWSSRVARTFGRFGRGRDRVVVGDGDAVDLLHDEHPSRRERLVDDAAPRSPPCPRGWRGTRCRWTLRRCSRTRARASRSARRPAASRRVAAPPRPAGRSCPAANRSTAASRCTMSSMPGPLHLHHDLLTGLEHRPVGLPDRRRRQRHEVERRELLLDGGTELALEHLADLVGRAPAGPTTAGGRARS